MKQTVKGMAVAGKGMGLVEVSQLCAPKRFRRKSWKPDSFVYWDDDGLDGALTMFDETGEIYSLKAEDVRATDWEIVK
jgi:hypothetical protein